MKQTNRDKPSSVPTGKTRPAWHKLAAMIFWIPLLSAGLIVIYTANSAFALETSSRHSSDPHYAEKEFFDLHICNWPDRPHFIMAVFSTTRLDQIKDVVILQPNGQALGQLDLKKHRVIKKKGRLEKRVVLNQLDLPAEAVSGWYRARIRYLSDRVVEAKDYVVIATMDLPDNLSPADGAEKVPPNTRLRWDVIPGAKHYRVFIRDMWNDGKLIHTSKLLDKPVTTLPTGLLKPEGWYSWRVHARDVNEHALLGDFNHGSLGADTEFSVASGSAQKN